MQIFCKCFSDNAIAINKYAKLFKHRINVSIHLSFSTFIHDDKCTSARFNILAYFSEFFGCKGHAWRSKQQKISLSHALIFEFLFIDFTLQV